MYLMCAPSARGIRDLAVVAIAVSSLAVHGPRRLAAQESAPESGPRAPAASVRQTLSLPALYQTLRLRSPRFAAARAQADAARARIPGMRRLPDPQLQLGAMNYRVPAFAPMEAIGMLQLQVMQMVPIAGKRGLRGQMAEALASANDARAEDVWWEQRSLVAMAFHDLYQADRTIDVAVETRALLQNTASVAQAMYAVGDARQAEVLRARVEIARMSEEITRMETMRASMVARLQGLLDEPTIPLQATPALPSLPSALPALAALVLEAEARRPMVRAGEAALRSAAAGERLARSDIWPDLQLGIQYGQRGGVMGTERMTSLMVGASLPIFARDRQFQMRAEAAAMTAMAHADLTAMRADTRARVTEAYATFQRGRTLRALYQTTVLPQARAAVTAALASYRVGEVNLMTLLDNQMTVNRYRQELHALEADQGKALAELEMLVGRELSEPNQRAARGED